MTVTLRIAVQDQDDAITLHIKHLAVVQVFMYTQRGLVRRCRMIWLMRAWSLADRGFFVYIALS